MKTETNTMSKLSRLETKGLEKERKQRDKVNKLVTYASNTIAKASRIPANYIICSAEVSEEINKLQDD